MLIRTSGYIVSFLFFLLFSTSCQNTSNDLDKDKLTIVTTTGHIADMVKNIVGNKAEVTALMGPGVDPHLYKASLSDLKQLSNADIIFYSGLHLEGKMGEVFHKLSRTKNVVAVSDGIPKELLLLADSANHIPDPHIWFDVILWRYCLQKTKDALIKNSPKDSIIYSYNAQLYDSQLSELNEFVTKEIASIPKKQRVLVTAHDAFGYFGKRYQMEVLGLQGISTLSEYGLSEITTLTRFLVSRNIRSVFVETSVSDKAINSVIEGCKQKGHHIKIGGSLYSDALGVTNSLEGTYIGMFKTNVNLIKKGLK